MTKAEIIDQVFIQVLGGVLTQDANVKRAEIENMLPPVMAAVMTNAQYQGRAEARAEYAATRLGSYAPAQEFYKVVEVTPVRDENTCRYYAVLPKLLDLPNNWNVSNVRVKASFDTDIVRVRSHSDLLGIPNTGQKFYWVVNEGHGHKMWFSDLNVPVQNLIVTAVVSPDALEMTDEVPCPPSVEAEVVSLLVQTFRNQRTMPADDVTDDNDINEQRQ